MPKKHNRTKKKKHTYFKKYDLYSDANPKDSFRMKYSTIAETKETIKRLKKHEKGKKYSHARIVQIANVLTQRLRVIYNNTGKGKTRYELANRYFEQLKRKTKKLNAAKKSQKRSGKILNPKTGRYVKKDGAIGKRILSKVKARKAR
jgi:aldehyde:ferredoxin oxidoreductase